MRAARSRRPSTSTPIRCPTARRVSTRSQASLDHAHRPKPWTAKSAAKRTIPPSDWAWAKCTADHPFPGTPDPTQICLKNGFDPKLLYQVVFTAKDPPVLGIGFAAFRDVGTFFKHAKADDTGTPNPLAESDHLGDLARRFAIGQFPARLSSSRLQSGRNGPSGLRRRLADHRRQDASP